MLAILIVFAGFFQAAFAADPTLVSTQYGTITGSTLGQSYVYKGIPYAAAPVGPLRWAPPSAPAPWNEPLAATRFGAKCPQLSLDSTHLLEGDEDCLFLNVWRPSAAAAKLPVLVFVHGGANVIGSASDALFGVDLYDGRYLAEHGPAVVVTLNYRLGALGFLALPELAKESGTTGNYGLLDQVQALRWVRDNIAAFGGDAGKVTIFGESAGAIDVLALLASPLGRGLFQRAIVESGFLTERPLAAAEANGAALAKAAGCEDLKCLRARSAEELARAADSRKSAKLDTFSLTIDGYALDAPVLDSLRAGRAAGLSLIIGTNADEMTTLGPAVANTDKIDTREKFEAAVRGGFGAAAPAVLAAYPLADYTSPRNAIESLLADSSTHCPSRRVARAFAANGQKVWRYLFRHVADNPYVAPYGAAHAFELPYVFHNLNPFTTTPREERLSAAIAGYWLAFARDGDPGAGADVAWPGFAADEMQSLDVGVVAEKGFRSKQCDFWDAVEK